MDCKSSVSRLVLIRRIFLLVINISMCSKDVNILLTERKNTCKNLNCDIKSNINVCGIRKQNTTVSLKLFENECALLKYGCSVEDKDAYGLINMDYCKQLGIETNADESNKIVTHNLQPTRKLEIYNNSECEFNCAYLQKYAVCGIRQDGEGYRVKLFENTCDLVKYNCNNNCLFIRTDMFICDNTLQVPSIPSSVNSEIYQPTNNVIVVDGSMLGIVTDANETIENFFAATHVLDLPIKEMDKRLKTRRMLLKNAGPVRVFTPWITIPKEILTDPQHMPTLSTCYHKCPTQCPDTYSPVCGVPGILAREPSIMFQNHCYMDVAQCKMYWENKSSTAISSSYIESSFLFCLGDQLNAMYRFLPLVKTLQHMGRLKKKSKFHYRLKNMRFFNNYAYKEPKLMG